MSRGSVHRFLLAGVVGLVLSLGSGVQGDENSPPPVSPPSSPNLFEEEDPKSEPAKSEKEAPPEEKKKEEKKKGDAKKPDEKAPEEKKPEEKQPEEKKPDEERVIREEVEPVVIPPMNDEAKKATENKKEEAPKETKPPTAPEKKQPVTADPVHVEPAAPAAAKPPANAKPPEEPHHEEPAAKSPPAKKPVETNKPPVEHEEEPRPEGATRPVPTPLHRDAPAAEVESGIYRCGNGSFHLVGKLGTAHYTGGEGRVHLAVLHLTGPSSPNPPFLLPASDANYTYYYQEPGCGDGSVLAWAFQKGSCGAESLWVMKYVRNASGQKSWVTHGAAQRTAVACQAGPGSAVNCNPETYDPPAPGDAPRVQPPLVKPPVAPEDRPISPSIRFEPLEAQVDEVPQPSAAPARKRGGAIIFRAQ